MAHFVAYECTFLKMYNNQLKSKQTQRNMGKRGIPELYWHPVVTDKKIIDTTMNITLQTPFCLLETVQ